MDYLIVSISTKKCIASHVHFQLRELASTHCNNSLSAQLVHYQKMHTDLLITLGNFWECECPREMCAFPGKCTTWKLKPLLL